MKFKVYVDYTNEDTPRPFYVGKGTSARVSSAKRNKYHDSIARKYGMNRIVVFESDDEQEVLGRECLLIKELKTYFFASDDGWGANFTEGGEGIVGYVFTEEQCQRLSEACAGEKNGMFGKHHSEETRKKIGDAERGWHHTDETKAILAEYAKKIHTGRTRSDETRRRISESCTGHTPWNKGKTGLQEGHMKGRHHSEETRKKLSEARKGKPPWNKGKKKTGAE